MMQQPRTIDDLVSIDVLAKTAREQLLKTGSTVHMLHIEGDNGAIMAALLDGPPEGCPVPLWMRFFGAKTARENSKHIGSLLRLTHIFDAWMLVRKKNDKTPIPTDFSTAPDRQERLVVVTFEAKTQAVQSRSFQITRNADDTVADVQPLPVEGAHRSRPLQGFYQGYRDEKAKLS